MTTDIEPAASDLVPVEPTDEPSPLRQGIRDSAGRILPGHSLNPAGRPKDTPLISPRIRKYQQLSVGELRALKAREDELTAADALAVTYALDALTTGKLSSGHFSRRDVLDRVDGPLQRGGDINVGVQVVIREYGGSGKPEDIG